MTGRRIGPPAHEALAPNGLFRRYRVVLRARQGEDQQKDVIEVEIQARTQGAARRAVRLTYPERVVHLIERID